MGKRLIFRSLLATGLSFGLMTTASAEFGTPTVDGGSLDDAVYTLLSSQTVADGFGNTGLLTNSYMANDTDNLYVGVSGNLSNNGVLMFFDVVPGGATEVATGPDNSFGTFDDLATSTSAGILPAGFDLDFAYNFNESGGNTFFDRWVVDDPAGDDAGFFGSANGGISLGGFDLATAYDTGATSQTAGLEFQIPLSELGVGPGDTVEFFCYSLGGGAPRFVANQVLPPPAVTSVGNYGTGSGDGISFDGTSGGPDVTPDTYLIVAPPSGNSVREVWAATENNAADFDAESFLVDGFDSRGIAFMPASAAGNSSGVDKVIVLPNESGGAQTLPFLRAADGELIGTSSVTWTNSGFLQGYDIDVDADGAMLLNGLGGAVSAAIDDQGTSMTQIIDGTLDPGGNSRAVDIAGSIVGGNATVFVGSGTSIACYDNFTTPGATVLDFEHVGNVTTGFGADVQSIAAISSTLFYAVDGGGGSPIKKFENSGSGFVATDITDLDAFVKTGIDVAGDFIFIAESGGAQDGFLVLRESTGDVYFPSADIDQEPDGAYDAGSGVDLNNGNFVASLAVNPATLQGFGLSSGPAGASDSAIVSWQAANSYVVPSGPFSEPSAAFAALQSSDAGVPALVSLDGNTTDTAQVVARAQGSLILQGNGNTIIVAPGGADALDVAGSTDGAYIALTADGENPLFCIEDVTLLPADQGAGALVGGGNFGPDAIRVTSAATEGFGLSMDGNTIAGNLGGTALSDPNDNQFANVTRFERGVYIPSTTTTAAQNKSVEISNHLSTYNDFRALEINVDGGDVELGPGVVLAYTGEETFALFSPNNTALAIDGDAGNRNLFLGSGQNDVDEEGAFFSGAAGSSFETLTYSDFIGNGAEIDFNEGLPVLTDNCYFANNGVTDDSNFGGNFRIGISNGPTTYTATISNTTIYDLLTAGSPQFGINFGFSGTDNVDLTLTNVVIAGAGDTAIRAFAGAENTVTLNGVGFANAGPDALAAEIDPGDLTIVDTISVSGNPGFINTVYSYPTPADYLQVGGDASFDDAGPGATDISGAGGPVIPGADVTDWNILDLD